MISETVAPAELQRWQDRVGETLDVVDELLRDHELKLAEQFQLAQLQIVLSWFLGWLGDAIADSEGE